MSAERIVRRKKRKVKFVPKKSKNSSINNPKTGTPVFGVFPEIDNESVSFPEGEIFLRYGEHVDAHRGFGVAHIWAEHEHELRRLGHESEDDVAAFVAEIIVSGASLYIELAGSRSVTVLQSSIGLAIVERREDGRGKAYYSIVTAYTGKEAHGTLIGSVR